MQFEIDTHSLATYIIGAFLVGLVTAVIRLWGMHMSYTRHVAEKYVSHSALTERLQPLTDEVASVKILAQNILRTVSELKGRYEGHKDAKRG